MLETLAATAASKYFFFFSGLVLALILIELRLNLRILFRKDDDLEYRVILPFYVAPDWALASIDTSKIASKSKGYFSWTK